MKSKIIWLTVVIGVAAFLVNNYQEQELKRAAKEAERERIQQEVKSVVSQVVARHDAISDWEERLRKGERFRTSPIFTMELEKLWKGHRPIFFIGSP